MLFRGVPYPMTLDGGVLMVLEKIPNVICVRR